MTRKCQIHTLQTNPLHREEETQNTDSHKTIEVKQISKTIAKLEKTQRTTPQNKDPPHNTHTQRGQQQTIDKQQ